jgi:hypothetical protein
MMANEAIGINEAPYKQRTPLYIACQKNNIELASYLIQRFEIDVNI